MIDYVAAQTIAMIAQTGSFEAAARQLNITPSAVSQRVRSFEDRLGKALIERGHPCRVTDAGAWLCRHMEHVGMLEQTLFEHLPGLRDPQKNQPVTLDIATNADSLATWLMPALADFSKSGQYLLNIAVDDEQHTPNWLRQGRVLGAVTSEARPVQGCVSKPLGRQRYVATASPDYIGRHFRQGVDVAALARAPALMFNQKDMLQQLWVNQEFGVSVALQCHALPSTQGFVDACCAGLGWGLNPYSLVKDHLESGALLELRPGSVFDVQLYWQISRLGADQLADLTKAVLRAAKQGLE